MKSKPKLKNKLFAVRYKWKWHRVGCQRGNAIAVGTDRATVRREFKRHFPHVTITEIIGT